MNYKINNTLFERKHHYVTILKESELLKQQMNEEVLDGAIEASRLDEINHICNLAFAGLLQEGLEFRYSRDTNASKESLIMTIDHVDYRCRVTALRGILRDKLEDYLKAENSPVNKESTITREEFPYQEPPYNEYRENPYIENPTELENPKSMPEYAPEESVMPARRFSFDTETGEKEPLSSRERVRNSRFTFREKDTTEHTPAPNFTQNTSLPEEEEEEEDLFAGSSEIENKLLASLLKSLGSGEDVFEDEDTLEEENKEPFPYELEQRVNPVPSESPIENDAKNTSETEPEENAEEDAVDWSVEMEEKEADAKVLCYETHRVMVSRGGTRNSENAFGTQSDTIPSSGEEIFFMIAPTKIIRHKGILPSVSIIVYAYYNGRAYYSGSFKNGDPDKNLIKMSIGDYEFLIRGMFKDGNFESHIVTTGDSAAEDVTIHVLEQKQHNPAPNKLRNGHLHFSYEGSDGETVTIDVYPVNEGDNTCIVMQKIEHPTRGTFLSQYCTEESKKILLRTKEGPRELICWWDEETLKAEVIPA